MLQFVAVNEGMLLTFATTAVWERDFVSFVDRYERIPNIWGQDDIGSMLQWVKEKHKRRTSFIDELKNLYNVTICGSCLENNDYNSKDWEIIFDKFRLADNRSYIPDGDLIKKFYDIQAGALCELIVTGSIRLFFINLDSQILIGGKYQKGQGDDEIAQQRAAKIAKQRINAYCLNHGLLKN